MWSLSHYIDEDYSVQKTWTKLELATSSAMSAHHCVMLTMWNLVIIELRRQDGLNKKYHELMNLCYMHNWLG